MNNLFENLQIMDENYDEFNEIAKQFKQFLKENNAEYVIDELTSTPYGLSFIIYNGDWKHEHLYVKHLWYEFCIKFGIEGNIYQDNEDSDEDTFTAYYSIEIANVNTNDNVKS